MAGESVETTLELWASSLRPTSELFAEGADGSATIVQKGPEMIGLAASL